MKARQGHFTISVPPELIRRTQLATQRALVAHDELVALYQELDSTADVLYDLPGVQGIPGLEAGDAAESAAGLNVLQEVLTAISVKLGYRVGDWHPSLHRPLMHDDHRWADEVLALNRGRLTLSGDQPLEHKQNARRSSAA